MALSTPVKVSMLATLLHERASVMEQMQATAKDFRSSRADGDGVPSSDYERDETLYSLLSGRLTEIDMALRRMESGTYGACADCGKDIPVARLRANPSAVLCVPCQAARELRLRRHSLRRVPGTRSAAFRSSRPGTRRTQTEDAEKW